MPASDYPSVLASLTPRRAQQFSSVVDLLERSKAAGSIPNSEFNGAKLPFSRAVEEAWESLVQSPYLWNRDYVATDAEREAMREFSGAPAPHLMGTFRKRADALGNTASGVAARAFLAEISPAMELMAHAKTIAVKRAPKDPEKPLTEVYSAPAASGTAMAMVNAALLDVTAAARRHLAQVLEDDESRLLDRYLEAKIKNDSAEVGRIHDFSPYAYAKEVGRGYALVHIREPLSALIKSSYNGPSRTHEVREDHKEILKERAEKAADLMCADFVNRNLAKLDSIIEAKGGFSGVEVIGRHFSSAGMDGSLRVSFEDGSSFEARTSVVWSSSIHGKPFTRYPVTFHDVVGPEGLMGRKLSEKEMNEDFAKAAKPDDAPSP